MATYLNDKTHPIVKLEELKKEDDKMSFFFICEKCGNVAEKIYHQYFERCSRLKTWNIPNCLLPKRQISARFPASQCFVALHRHLYFR